MANDNLILIHLSDIHFRKQEYFDIDDDLRKELEKDACKLTGKIGPVDGILISGDIAFSGQTSEYENALNWLERFCNQLKCPYENVWTIPGNHDVNRKIIDESKLIKTIHQELRTGGADNIDQRIQEFLQDKEARALVYKSIENYSLEFASKFRCRINAENPFVTHNFTLNDGSILKLRGVNSTLVSYKFDDDANNKLVIGSYQSTISREDGVEYLLMCHHPYPWLLDQDNRKDHWLSRAKIQLFGHKHNQRLERVNDCLVMTAGAMHPDRREPNWTPRYNILRINISKEEKGQRLLNVNVYQRTWKSEAQDFEPEFSRLGEEYRHFPLPIDEWVGEISTEEKAGISNEVTLQPIEPEEKESVRKDDRMDPARRLTYRFLRLPYHTRISIAHNLGLLEDDDKGLEDAELFQRFFRRAKQNDKLAELWSKVESVYDGDLSNNPFAQQIGDTK